MLFLSLVASLAAATTALAQGMNTTQSFLIKTKLAQGQTTTHNETRFENLFLAATSTVTKGEADAILTSNITQALQAYFSPNHVDVYDEFIYMNFPRREKIYRLNFVGDKEPLGFRPRGREDAGWDIISIGPGNGTSINRKSLYQGKYFESWMDPVFVASYMACDWWHGVPQLFVRFSASDLARQTPMRLPQNCAAVDLTKVWL